MERFDEAYRYPSIEDIELGYRLKRAGYEIRLIKTLQVKHLKRWDAISLLKADIFYRAIPWTELIWRDRQFINDLNLQLKNRLSVLLTYGLLSAIVVSVWWKVALFLAGLQTVILLAINAPVYRFFQHQRGLWFPIQTIPWHWLYYFYSGIDFAIGTLNYLFRKQGRVQSSYL